MSSPICNLIIILWSLPLYWISFLIAQIFHMIEITMLISIIQSFQTKNNRTIMNQCCNSNPIDSWVILYIYIYIYIYIRSLINLFYSTIIKVILACHLSSLLLKLILTPHHVPNSMSKLINLILSIFLETYVLLRIVNFWWVPRWYEMFGFQRNILNLLKMVPEAPVMIGTNLLLFVQVQHRV